VTRVLVVASSPVTRAGLESILLHEEGGRRFTVVGSSASSSMLMEQVEELEPQVVLLELASPDEPLVPPGERGAAPALVVLTDAGDGSWVSDALRMGAHAILPRNAGPGEIVAAVAAAAVGLVTLPPSAVDALLSTPVGGSATAESIGGARDGMTRVALTPRETEVLGMLAEGLANKQIAVRLGISEHTVKFHVASVYAKLGVASRTEAVRAGVRGGLVVL
jgi:two-component system, NarL family, response regulator YdfI